MRTPSVFIATSTLLALAAPCAADVTNAAWGGTGTFYYRIVHMPDLDQRRGGLANNGANHCVPTSTINLFAYAANHGFPWVPPGPGSYQSQGMFNTATNAISQLGALMGTSGTNGTNGSGTQLGLNLWAGQTGILMTVRRSRTSSYTPTVAKMVQLACQGWIMNFAYGRYNIVGQAGSIPILDRTGGHAVTMVRAQRSGSSYQLRYRDPADDSTLSTQSSFVNKTVYPVAYTAFFGSDLRTMNAIAYPSDDGKVRIVDSYWGIRPMFGMVFGPGSGLMEGLGGGTIKLADPTPLEGSVNLTLPSISISNFTELRGLAFSSDHSEGLVLTRSVFAGQPTLLRSLDLFTGQMTTLPDAPQDLVQIEPSREGWIYSFDEGGKLYRLGETGGIDAANSSIPTPTAIAFDDVNDRLALLSVPQRRVAKYNKSLGVLQNLVVPTPVPMSGDGSVRIDPTTGEAWFFTSAAPSTLYNIYMPAAGGGPLTRSLALPTVPGGLQEFEFGDNGELLLLGGSSIVAMKKTGDFSWVSDPDSPFHGLPGGTRMVLSRSTNNNDPAVHDLPAWNNIPANELLPIGEDRPDCDADLDGDDMVNGADLGVLLARWGTDNGAADLNQDGVVNGADLGELLSAWGNCL